MRLRGRLLFAVLALGSATAFGVAAARAATPLEQRAEGGVTIDWQAGTLTGTGGAAADLRMPNVEISRAGAVRRARAAALARLRHALAALPLGAGKKLSPEEIDRALGRAREVDLQYQSNGGAVLRLEVRFGDWLEPALAASADGRPQPATTFSVSSMPLGAAPTAKVGARDVRVGAAVYRVGSPPADAKAVPAKVDAAGRLVVPAKLEVGEKLATGLTMIYVGKVSK